MHQINEALLGPGVLCHVDDILMYRKDQTEHEARLHATLKKMQAAVITLYESECWFNQKCITFLGHVIAAMEYHYQILKRVQQW